MLFKVINGRRFITTLLAVVLFTLSVTLVSQTVTQAVSVSVRQLPIYCVDTAEKKVALTFDAAWSDGDTQELIAILSQYNAKATVFCVGEWVERCPQSVKAFYDAGHEIGNHSDTHAAFSKLDGVGIINEINACNEKIHALTGEYPSVVRAPSGDYNNASVEAAESLGMHMIQWSVDSLDYKGLTIENIKVRVVSKTENGSIILFHNGVENTPAALREILSSLSAEGYTFVTVSELIYSDNYRIDHAGKQYSTASVTPSDGH